MIVKALCFFLCIIPHLSAFEEVDLESGAAEYKERTLYLTEGVVVNHPIGRLASQEMILKPIPGVSPIRLGSADLSKQVRIDLADGAMLKCTTAAIDFTAGHGIFKNDSEQEYVIFSQNLKDKQERLPFIVKARTMELNFDPQPPHPTLKKIEIHRDVQIDYNHDFIASGDEGTFIRKNPIQTGLSGTIVLQADEGKLCTVTNRSGDLIRSALITIDTTDRTIHFDKSSGSLVPHSSKVKQKIDFAADKVLWNDRDNSVLLQRNVALKQMGFGKLTTDGELKITQRCNPGCDQGKKQLSTIESFGKTVLVQGGDLTGPLRTLTCYGKLLVDHVCSTITMESPPEGEQVFLEDARGQVHADKATVDYSLEKSILKVLLEGHVQIRNAHSEKPQYALADTLEYHPATQEMILRAEKGNRVLLYDEGKDLQISAPGISLKRDLLTQKETIKGLGDVRFSLAKEEFGELRRKFSLKEDRE